MAPATPTPLIARARKDWKKCADAEETQRKAILEAKKFRALDQWPAAIRLAREGAGSMSGQPPQPPRPCLTVDRLSQPVRQVSNQIKNADFGFNVLPNGMGADTETADILKGYLRRMQNQSRGEAPIEWAADGAIEGGLGWLRMRTRFVHEAWDGDPKDPEAYDQELVLERIANSLSVYCDPSAVHPVRRDALFMFVVQDMDRDAYIDRHGDEDVRGLEEFQSTGDMAGWVSKDKIRIAEYWRIEFEQRRIWSTETAAGEGEPPKGVKPTFDRVIRAPRVKGSIINAVRELEPLIWVGRRIPLFPVLGEELNVDGKPVLRGIIAMGMDAQRMVNYTYSAGVEIFALGNKKAPIVDAASIANHKAVWDTRNVYNWSYLPVDSRDEQGQELMKPVFDESEAPIQAAVALMRVSEDAIKASTSTGDASLGNSNPNERSGKALEALKVQSDLANSNYAANVERALIEIADEAVYIIPKITRPGQILHIMGMDDEPEQVMVGKPFQRDENGIPQEAPPEVTEEVARMKDNLWKFYDPTRGRYSVTVTVGKAQATRREEGAAALGELIPHLPPEMAAVATPDYVEQLSFPGSQKIAEKLRKVLPPNLQDDDGQNQPDPAMLAQQLAQMQQQNQELQQLANDNQTKLQIEQGKAAAEMEREKLRADVEMEKARMDNAARIEVARIGAAKALLDTHAAAEEERLSTGLQIEADAELQARQQAHEAAQSDADRSAAASSQSQAEAHASAEGEASREAAAEQAKQAAAAKAAKAKETV